MHNTTRAVVPAARKAIQRLLGWEMRHDKAEVQTQSADVLAKPDWSNQ